MQYQKNGQVFTVTTAKGPLTLTVLTEKIIHVQNKAALAFHSYAVEGNKAKPVAIKIQEDADKLELITPQLKVEVFAAGFVDTYDANDNLIVGDYRKDRVPLARDISEQQAELIEAEGHQAQRTAEKAPVEIVKQLPAGTHFYGLGDKTGFLDKYDCVYDNWNTDEPEQIEGTTRLYKSVPFLITKTQICTYGMFFDNSFASHLDLGHESPEYFFYTAKGGGIDYYLVSGPTMAQVVSQYTYLTGRTPLPQKWTLGYQQSRYSYGSQKAAEGVVAKLRGLKLPCDVLHLDIDYMDGYRVFTIDPQKFPHIKQMIADFKKAGMHVVTIIDPGVKQDAGYPIYQAGESQGLFATNPDGSVYINKVWPGNAAYPDFGRKKVRAWWADNQTILTNLGVSGVWNDMNEPASFAGPIPDETVFYDEDKPSTIQQMHNLYGHNMDRATYAGLKQATGKRPFVISRAVFAGTQKYSTVWTGDNRSSWAHLQMMIPQILNLGLSGFAFSGADIGGFLNDTTAELLQRWIEAATFSPLMRNHSCVGTRMQEPWQFDAQTLTIYRQQLQLRYQLLDYLYDLFAEETQTGLPLMRPLVMDYEDDPQTYNCNDEFLVGDSLLAAPVVMPSATQRMVYLPEGKWEDFWTQKVYQGRQSYIIDAAADKLPLFVKAGSVLPLRAPVQHVDIAKETALTFKLWGDAGTYQHYQDNGEDFDYQKGAYNLYQVTFTKTEASVALTHTGYAHPYQTIILQRNDGEKQELVYNADSQSYEAAK